MKKLFALLLALTLLLTTACGSTAETETYTPQTRVRFNQLLDAWLPGAGLSLGSMQEEVAFPCKERDTDYKKESRLKTQDRAVLPEGGLEAELMFSDAGGLFGFWVEMAGAAESIMEADCGEAMHDTGYSGVRWLMDDVFIWAEDRDDGTCMVLVCTGAEAVEKYPNDMEYLLAADGAEEDAGSEEEPTGENEQAGEDEQPPAEDGFISDWTEGNENIYGYGTVYNGTVDQLSTNDDYRFVTQDGWVYYVWINNGIYKMPIDAVDGGQVFKLATLDGWIYHLSVMKDWLYYFENDQLVRLRTDGMIQEVLPLQSEETRDTDGFYLAYDQLYYIGKTRRSASEFQYELRKLDLNTMEDTAIVSGVRSIEGGYRDSLFIRTPDKAYQRIDLEGNLLAEYYELPKYLWDESGELFIGTIGESTYAGDNLGYVWLNGDTERNEFLSAFGFGAGDWYICEELRQMVHTKYDSERGIYCTDMNTFDTVKLNGDRTEVFYSWGDGYIYYPTSVDRDGRGVRVFCRIRPDGTDWEDVSWMFY